MKTTIGNTILNYIIKPRILRRTAASRRTLISDNRKGIRTFERVIFENFVKR